MTVLRRKTWWAFAVSISFTACVQGVDRPPASAWQPAAPAGPGVASPEPSREPASTDSAHGSGPRARVRKPGAPLSIAVLGSSTAAGAGLSDPATSWVGRYASYITAEYAGAQVKNLAVDGYTTYQVLPTGTVNPPGRPSVDEGHNVTAALAGHPDAIIVNLPSNDAAKGVPVEETMKNLRAVAAKAKEAGVDVWLGSPQPRSLDAAGTSLLIGLRDRMKQEFGKRAIDFWVPLAAPDGAPLPAYNQGDGIHPNAEGHRLLFEQVKRADIPSAVLKPR